MKYILALTILFSSNCFAYVYADDIGDASLDSLSHRMQQQDIEDRLNAIESQQQAAENDRWQKDLFDSVNSR